MGLVEVILWMVPFGLCETGGPSYRKPLKTNAMKTSLNWHLAYGQVPVCSNVPRIQVNNSVVHPRAIGQTEILFRKANNPIRAWNHLKWQDHHAKLIECNNDIFQDTFDTTDNKWWILSTLKTAKVCPITFDLCWSPWAFTTDLMVWLNLFISLSNLLVMPTSPKTCKAGDAGLPYSQSLRKKSSIKKVLHFQKRR